MDGSIHDEEIDPGNMLEISATELIDEGYFVEVIVCTVRMPVTSHIANCRVPK